MQYSITFKRGFFFLTTAVFILLFQLLSAPALAFSDDWYLYQGSSSTHSFSLRFPPEWQAHTIGNNLQGFAPQDIDNGLYFSVREFEGLTYDQVINYYLNDSTQLIEVRDQVRLSTGEDILEKEVIYQDLNVDEKYAITLIKRGSSIFALTNANLEGVSNFPVPDEYNDIVSEIFDSFAFTDEWRQYIDYQENYTFIFPANLSLNTLNNGIEIPNPSYLGGTLFTVLKYQDIPISEVAEYAEGYGEKLERTEQIIFHGIEKAIAATYNDHASGKKLSRIYLEKEGSSFGLTNINIEDNFPHLNYYDQYITEMLESFEFFSINNAYSPYLYFPDVRDNHPNAYAVNALKKAGIIDGYPDGNFKPDGEINRAELTKMIVAIGKTPDSAKYHDCFPDVTDEWFAPYVCFAASKGWVEGYSDGTFQPANPINRAEALKVIFGVLLSTQIDETETLEDRSVLDVSTDDWYSKYFIFADNRDLLDKQHITEQSSGYNYYPDKNITRKEVAESIYLSGQFL